MRAIKIIAGLCISALFLWLALRGIDFSGFLHVLKKTSVAPLLGGAALFLFAYFVRTIRWKVMLRGVMPSLRIRQLLSAIFIGVAANNVLPLRAGEFVRAFAVKKYGGISGSSALSSIVLERVLDGLSLLIILSILLITYPFPAWVARVGFFAVLIFGGASVFLAGFFFGRHKISGKIKIYLERKPSKKWMLGIVERLLEGLSLFDKPTDFIYVIILSLCVWGIEASVYWLVGASLGIKLTWAAVLLCLVVVNFGITIPSSPGFVGTFEFACVISLGVFSLPKDEAVAFALLLHALFWVILVAGGLAFAWTDHGGFKKLAAAKGGRNMEL